MSAQTAQTFILLEKDEIEKSQRIEKSDHADLASYKTGVVKK